MQLASQLKKEVILEITEEMSPCNRMDEQCLGLTAALTPDWRGGITCRVIEGGDIALDDVVEMYVRLR